jgi:hypothetical protein
MPRRRLIIELYGSTPEYAQQEVDSMLKSINGACYGIGSVFVDPNEYSGSEEDSLHIQAGPGAVGALLNENFQYHVGCIGVPNEET